VTDLIAATLGDESLGVSEWGPPAEAADHLSRHTGPVVPDASEKVGGTRHCANLTTVAAPGLRF
jgi:hypothetical protein